MHNVPPKPLTISGTKTRNATLNPTIPHSNSYSPEHDNPYTQSQSKTQITKLKRLLKQAQAKRTQITRQCSELATRYEKLEQENAILSRKVQDCQNGKEGDQFRYDELRFLNKQLSAEIEVLQVENQGLSDRLKYQADVLEKKYEELEQRTYKRIEQSLKRIKKSIHYLTSLSAKQLQKTKDIQIENLSKAAQILRGKYSQPNRLQAQIEQLMNPIRNIQQDLHLKCKQVSALKEENTRLLNQVRKHKKIEKELLPQYKEAVEKLKKNLGQVRMQLSENQYDKMQVKRKFQEKLREGEIRYEELMKEHRKIKLENKIYEQKMEEMEDDVEEEKQRLMGENQLLKKLYKSEDFDQDKKSQSRDLNIEMEAYEYKHDDSDLDLQPENKTEAMSYKTANQFRKPVRDYLQMGRNQEKAQSKERKEKEFSKYNNLKKNYSTSNLRSSGVQDPPQAPSRNKQVPLQIRQSPAPMASSPTYPQISQSRQSNSKRKNYDHLRLTKQGGQRNRLKEKAQQKVEVSDYCIDNEHVEHEDHDEEEHIDHGVGESGVRSGYTDEGNSFASASQDGLKNQIMKIDQEIMEIQKTLDRELNLYK